MPEQRPLLLAVERCDVIPLPVSQLLGALVQQLLATQRVVAQPLLVRQRDVGVIQKSRHSIAFVFGLLLGRFGPSLSGLGGLSRLHGGLLFRNGIFPS